MDIHHCYASEIMFIRSAVKFMLSNQMVISVILVFQKHLVQITYFFLKLFTLFLRNHILQFSSQRVSFASFSISTGTLKFWVSQGLVLGFPPLLYLYSLPDDITCAMLKFLTYANDTQALTSPLNFSFVYKTSSLMFPYIWDIFPNWAL
jgi:hypothetical protein